MAEESFLVKCYNRDAETDLTTLYQFRNFESFSSLNESPEYEVAHHKFRKFAGHSNGIVCISHGYFNAFLINPALREIRPLPIIPSWRPPESCEHGIGFGFDESTNDYKVVRMITMYRDSPGLPQYVDIEIYTLSTNYWRKVGRVAGPPSIFHGLESPVYFKGLIHWLVEPCRSILTFNMATEVFAETSLPSDWKDYYAAQLFVMDDSNMALVASVCDHWYDWLMDVWVMKEHGMSESWTRLYSVPPPSAYITYIKPLWLWRKDKLVMSTWELTVICYDFATEQHYQIRQFEDDGLFELVAFHESLVSTYNV